MKAKEYADRYAQQGKTIKAAQAVCIDIFKEFKPIAESRHARSDSAGISICRELNEKWKTFVRLANNDLRPDGFQEMIKRKHPELYSLLKEAFESKYSTICVECSTETVIYAASHDQFRERLSAQGWSDEGYKYSVCPGCEKKSHQLSKKRTNDQCNRSG